MGVKRNSRNSIKLLPSPPANPDFVSICICVTPKVPTQKWDPHTVHTLSCPHSSFGFTFTFTFNFSFTRITTNNQMASSSGTTPSTFSSDAAAAAAANRENKRVVTGYPLLARPGDSRVVLSGYPHVRVPQPQPPPTPPPPPATVYLHQLVHHHNQHHRVQQLPREQVWLYRLVAAAFCFFFFMGCLLFTLWLFLRPRLPQVQVASATLSPLGTTATNVSFACNVSLLLTNPNRKLTIVYDSLELFVIYQLPEVPLFNAQVPSFVHPKKNDTFLHVQMGISNACVGNAVVEALKGDLVAGSMSLGVKVFAFMRLESEDWKTSSHLIKFSCDNVILGFSSVNGPGNMIHPHKDCRVGL